MLGWIKNIFASPAPPRPARSMPAFSQVPLRVRARYDAAMTTDENRRHWANADHLAADAANNMMVRRILRSRARYEVANNSYARGIVLTIANDTVGTGPRLQLLTDDGDANRTVELEFLRWADTVRLAEKLRTMRMARTQDGEVFAMLVANPKLDSPIKLDLRLIEADQVATPVMGIWPLTPQVVDGVIFDTWGNPIEYHVLKNHPGALVGNVSLDFDRIPAASVIHYYRSDRPGQSPRHPGDHAGVAAVRAAPPLHAGGDRGGGDGGRLRGRAVHRRPGQRRSRSGRADGPGGSGTPHGDGPPRRLEARPGHGRAAHDHLRRVQEGNPQRDRPLPEHAVQRRRR